MSRVEALQRAEQAELDVVEISPLADPPVARIVDWGKYNYQKMKEQQRSKRSTKVSELKQIRFGLKIGTNDLNIKTRKIREFLESGHKVKISLLFRGREMAHQELGFALIRRVIESLEDVAAVDQEPQLAGRNLSAVMRSSGNAKAKTASRDSQADQD